MLVLMYLLCFLEQDEQEIERSRRYPKLRKRGGVFRGEDPRQTHQEWKGNIIFAPCRRLLFFVFLLAVSHNLEKNKQSINKHRVSGIELR